MMPLHPGDTLRQCVIDEEAEPWAEYEFSVYTSTTQGTTSSTSTLSERLDHRGPWQV